VGVTGGRNFESPTDAGTDQGQITFAGIGLLAQQVAVSGVGVVHDVGPEIGWHSSDILTDEEFFLFGVGASPEYRGQLLVHS
jgi:hypothetical protein